MDGVKGLVKSAVEIATDELLSRLENLEDKLSTVSELEGKVAKLQQKSERIDQLEIRVNHLEQCLRAGKLWREAGDSHQLPPDADQVPEQPRRSRQRCKVLMKDAGAARQNADSPARRPDPSTISADAATRNTDVFTGNTDTPRNADSCEQSKASIENGCVPFQNADSASRNTGDSTKIPDAPLKESFASAEDSNPCAVKSVKGVSSTANDSSDQQGRAADPLHRTGSSPAGSPALDLAASPAGSSVDEWPFGREEPDEDLAELLLPSYVDCILSEGTSGLTEQQRRGPLDEEGSSSGDAGKLPGVAESIRSQALLTKWNHALHSPAASVPTTEAEVVPVSTRQEPADTEDGSSSMEATPDRTCGPCARPAANDSDAKFYCPRCTYTCAAEALLDAHVRCMHAGTPSRAVQRPRTLQTTPKRLPSSEENSSNEQELFPEGLPAGLLKASKLQRCPPKRPRFTQQNEDTSTPPAFPCELCRKGYMQRENLEKHMRAAHSASSLHMCEVCGSNFEHVSFLKLHLRKTHGIVKKPVP